MTAPVTPVPIVAYSGSLPDPSDPTTYGTRGRAVWLWETTSLYNGMNALGTATYTNAVAAAESAEAATMTAGALMWNAATNYATGQNAISPTDMQTYRRNSPGGVDATDPSASANWTLVGGRFLKKAGDTMTGNLLLDSTARIAVSGSGMDVLPSFAGPSSQSVFRNASTNQSTYVGAAANGTGGEAGFYASAGSYQAVMKITSTGVSISASSSLSSPTPKPINFSMLTSTGITFNTDGTITAYGIRGRQGTSGASPSNSINFHYTGSALQAWVDTTNLGNITITSDYRIKRDIKTMDQPALERIAALRPVLYKYRHSVDLSQGVPGDHYEMPFPDDLDGVVLPDDREREGFIAHELAEVIPSAVEGEKDAPNQIQSLRVDALLAVLVKAVQEQQEQIEELRALVGK